MFSAIERQQLLTAARESIRHGLNFGTRIDVDPSRYSPELRRELASFVTLKIDDLLRGCIGNIAPRETLVESVSHNAHSAAFHDPRFGMLHADEFPLLKIEISVLSELEPIDFASEQELIDQLRPGVDGLVITTGSKSATFLPAVWQQLPASRDFLEHLKEKAGLPPGAWPADLEAQRFTTDTVAS